MKFYTMKDIKAHNQKDDCWIVVSENVYDITAFLSTHPGGSSILMNVAGDDATDYFYALHRPEIIDSVAHEYLIGRLLEYSAKL